MENPDEEDVEDEKVPILFRSFSSSPSSWDNLSVWSFLSFGWYTPVLEDIKSKIESGQHPNIDEDQNIPPLPKENRTDHVCREFKIHWEKELQDHPYDTSVTRPLLKAFLRPYLLACAMSFVAAAAQFVGPVVLQMIMPYLLDPSSSMTYGLTLTLAIVSAQITSSLCNKHASYICFQVGSRVRTALVFAIFEKS
eukprot:jgi/Psemu1/286966/fgenesh1_pg.167_\